VRWVKDNIAHFGGDPDKLFLKGHSAGAHIAAMLSIDARWLSKVGTLVNFSPQYVAAHACTLAQGSRSVKANDAARPARSAAPGRAIIQQSDVECGDGLRPSRTKENEKANAYPGGRSWL
jgi:carboxylesterase type B